jgi:predicted Ser/Thr protein kinase
VNAPPVAADQAPTRKEVHPREAASAVLPTKGRVGEYELLDEVARGGMGVVYRALQIPLNRTVALKMILTGKLADEEDIQRFRTEAEAAARLQHPNIVKVHEVGEFQGNHYFTMEYIEGQSLAQRLSEGPLPGRHAARYVQLIARAVHHAHRQGILHRDLKPSNILIDADDEPHVTDFGLAKHMNKDQGHTRTGAVLGTPSYMPPEQAQGRTSEMTPASDVYSLGAILYELITGRPPFKAETPYDTVMQVIQNDAVPPRLLNPRIDADLETICLKCLQKDPRHRYVTAEALAEDLRRYLDGEPISARSVNMFEMLSRMLGRGHNDVAFSAWSSMLLTMAVVIAVEHVLVFFLIAFEGDRRLVFSARFIQFVLLVFLFWYHRGNRLLPTSQAEREIWSIWIGYFLAYGGKIVATRLLNSAGVIDEGTNGPKMYLTELLPYPYIALASGLALFTMGSNYWGICYLLGLAFMLIGVLMPLHLTFAPLEFGLMWSMTLTALGLHLRRRGQDAAAQRTTPKPRDSTEKM